MTGTLVFFIVKSKKEAPHIIGDWVTLHTIYLPLPSWEGCKMNFAFPLMGKRLSLTSIRYISWDGATLYNMPSHDGKGRYIVSAWGFPCSFCEFFMLLHTLVCNRLKNSAGRILLKILSERV